MVDALRGRSGRIPLLWVLSSATPVTVTVNGGGTGTTINVGGVLTIGDPADVAGTTTTFNNETNDRILDVNGSVNITTRGILQASSTSGFTDAGNFTNNGTFTVVDALRRRSGRIPLLWVLSSGNGLRGGARMAAEPQNTPLKALSSLGTDQERTRHRPVGSPGLDG